MKITNNLDCVKAYLMACEEGQYAPKPDRIGVTGLIISPKIRRLTLEHWAEITADAADFLERLLGTAWHSFLEGYVKKTGGRPEVKWELPIDGLTLVGKADAVYEDEIQDHKLYKAFAFCRKAYDDTIKKVEEQLNCLNYLKFKVEGKAATKLTLIPYIKDFSAAKKLQEKDYPAKISSINIDIWSMESCEEFIRARISLHKNPNYECSDEDKWVRPENWAVMRKGGKKAERLLDTEAEAQAYIIQRGWAVPYSRGEVWIEQRKSAPANCLVWCQARNVCPFAKGL